MEPEKTETVVAVNEDAELDKELGETLTAIKAGNAPEIKKEETLIEGEKEGASKPQETDPAKNDEYDFRIPNKGKFESDESYEKRIELMDLVKRRKLAKTEEQKAVISEEIKTTKSQIKNLNGTDKIINPLNQVAVTVKEEEEDEATKADKERLRQLGGATKEDIQNILQEERQKADVTNTLEKFVDRHPDLKDDDVREVFFDFVEQNYNYAGKGGKELMTVLELARESMFKPSETIQERVLKGANVQEKVNAMQFPGGTVTKAALSPELRKDLDDLKATGMSEEKALELISD